MRTAQIILPVKGNGPENEFDTWNDIHMRLVAVLTRAFGGVTVTKGRGAWINSRNAVVDEKVRIYTVAGADTPFNNGQIKGAAEGAATQLRQEAVYVQDFTGNVEVRTLT